MNYDFRDVPITKSFCELVQEMYDELNLGKTCPEQIFSFFKIYRKDVDCSRKNEKKGGKNHYVYHIKKRENILANFKKLTKLKVF